MIDTAAGLGEFYSTDGHGNLSVLRKHTGWRRSWTHIISADFFGRHFGQRNEFLFYDAAAGFGEFYTTGGNGNLSVLQEHTGWRKSWTHIIPRGNFNRIDAHPDDLLFYDAAVGLGEFYTTDEHGGIAVLTKHKDWRRNWTHIIPGHFGGSNFTDLLFYDAATGLGEFYTTDGHGNLSVLQKHTGWRKNWTHIIPGHFGGSYFTDLLFYDAATGLGEFYTTDGHGNLSVLTKHTGWRRNWTHIIPGHFGGSDFTDLLFYDAAAGLGEFYTTDGHGNVSVLQKHTGWRKNWTEIVPGGFSSGLPGFSTTTLLFYTA